MLRERNHRALFLAPFKAVSVNKEHYERIIEREQWNLALSRMGTETAVPPISIHDPNQPDQIPPESRSSHYCCHYCRWLLSPNIFVVLEIFACLLFNYSINSRHEVIC